MLNVSSKHSFKELINARLNFRKILILWLNITSAIYKIKLTTKNSTLKFRDHTHTHTHTHTDTQQIQLVKMKNDQSNSYRKNLRWLHLNDKEKK